MRIYLCACFARASEMAGVAAVLTEAGHTVVSSWHNDPIWLKPFHGESSEDRDARCAERDINDLNAAHCLVLFAENGDVENGTRGGRWVEFGIAWARSMLLLVVGRRENIFTHIRRRVAAVEDVPSLVEWLQDC